MLAGAADGDMEKVRECITAQWESCVEQGRQPSAVPVRALLIAVAGLNVEIVNYLLQCNVDPYGEAPSSCLCCGPCCDPCCGPFVGLFHQAR